MENNDATCITDGCERPIKIKSRRLCGPCYKRAWNNGELTDEVHRGRPPEERGCSEEGCTRVHKAYDFCKLHLEQARREGRVPANVCDFEGCGRVRHIDREGLCLTHYRQKKAGKALAPIPPRQAREGHCNGPECSEPIAAKGLCSAHYWQQHKGQELTPIKRVSEDLRGKPCTICVRHGEERSSYTTDGLCRTHARRRSSDEEEWDRPVPQKAPNGAGHIDANGYRLIQHEGRQRREHCVFIEQLLGRPLRGAENVHHVNGHRADNRTDGPLRLVNGKLRSGNLELWSTAQPAGQEVGPKLDWAVEMQEEYAEFLRPEYLERMAAVLRSHGCRVDAGRTDPGPVRQGH